MTSLQYHKHERYPIIHMVYTITQMEGVTHYPHGEFSLKLLDNSEDQTIRNMTATVAAIIRWARSTTAHSRPLMNQSPALVWVMYGSAITKRYKRRISIMSDKNALPDVSLLSTNDKFRQLNDIPPLSVPCSIFVFFQISFIIVKTKKFV